MLPTERVKRLPDGYRIVNKRVKFCGRHKPISNRFRPTNPNSLHHDGALGRPVSAPEPMHERIPLRAQRVDFFENGFEEFSRFRRRLTKADHRPRPIGKGCGRDILCDDQQISPIGRHCGSEEVSDYAVEHRPFNDETTKPFEKCRGYLRRGASEAVMLSGTV